METIRKKICLDGFISHRNGISPYILKDVENTDIQYVDSIISESNYGSFPCDFALMSTNVITDGDTGIDIRKYNEISRLRYSNALRWYNEVNENIKNGVFLKRIPYNYDNITFVGCNAVENPLGNCGVVNSASVSTEKVDGFLWLVDETEENSMFDVPTTNLSYFKTYRDGIYESDENFDNDIVFAINGYDEYLEYEDKWNEWWETNWNLIPTHMYNIWEQDVFDSEYVKPSYLRFIYDFEKYILGKVQVPEKFYYDGEFREIEGSKVPKFVFYLNYMEYLTWFTDNEEFLESNEDLQREWEKRGGENFKLFLETEINPIFILANEIPETGEYVYFDYVSQNIELDLAFINEAYEEYSYAAYEYSIGPNGELVDGTIEYEAPEDGNESALTPSFLITNSAITVESKLNTLFTNDVYYINNEIYGVFSNFDGGGKLFKCVVCSGQSSTPEKILCFSGNVEYYTKTGDDVWNIVKSIDIKENKVRIKIDEKLPKTQNNAFQVVGINEISELEPEIEQINSSTNTNYSDDGNLKVVSSITNYYKSITKKYLWWECISEGNTGITCGDGEDIDFNHAEKYRNLLLLSCVPSASETSSVGDEYYYMIKYDNGYTNVGNGRFIDRKSNPKPLKLPFSTEKVNIESYSGDFSDITKYDMVINKSNEDNVLKIEYVIGATEGKDINITGIHYIDTYDYFGNVFVDAVVDGFYNAQILYEKAIPKKELVYSDDFNATRYCVKSIITGMEIGTQWTPESSLRAYLYTDDSFDNLIEYPSIGVDITFNRGNAAAWEKHFKLSECNTFEDLQNLGNNYFNL